jgi:hypothetical protein
MQPQPTKQALTNAIAGEPSAGLLLKKSKIAR